MRNFKKDNCVVIKKALNKDVCSFIADYFILKKQVHQTYLNCGYYKKESQDFGRYDDPQAVGTYSHYGDIAMDTILKMLKSKVEKATGISLFENYSYARIYKKGDVLKKHTDRFSCEISATLNLSGEKWPIFIDYKNNGGDSVTLKQGEMLIYKGCHLPHWREALEEEKCIQVFLHYNDMAAPNSLSNKNDGRLHLGLPVSFSKNYG